MLEKKLAGRKIYNIMRESLGFLTIGVIVKNHNVQAEEDLGFTRFFPWFHQLAEIKLRGFTHVVFGFPVNIS